MSLEIECLDNVIFAQFFEKTGVELRDTSSVGVETGQYCYLQLSELFSVLACDVLLVESCKNLVCNVE